MTYSHKPKTNSINKTLSTMIFFVIFSVNHSINSYRGGMRCGMEHSLYDKGKASKNFAETILLDVCF